MDDDLRAKIIALLTETGRTEAEADQARSIALKLMAKHRVTFEDVHRTPIGESQTEIDRYGWHVAKHVMVTIARITRTECFTSALPTRNGRRSDRRVATYVGLASDVAFALWLLDTCVEAGKRAASGAGDNRRREDTLVAFTAFLLPRLRAMIPLDPATGRPAEPTGTDLVLVDQLGAYMKREHPKLRDLHARSRTTVAGDAYRRGKTAAETVSLNRPVSAGGRPAIGG